MPSVDVVYLEKNSILNKYHTCGTTHTQFHSLCASRREAAIAGLLLNTVPKLQRYQSLGLCVLDTTLASIAATLWRGRSCNT